MTLRAGRGPAMPLSHRDRCWGPGRCNAPFRHPGDNRQGGRERPAGRKQPVSFAGQLSTPPRRIPWSVSHQIECSDNPQNTGVPSKPSPAASSRSRLSELAVDKVQGDVQDRGGVGQPTYAEEVDTRFGIRPRNLQGQSPGGLNLNPLAGSPHCLDRLTQ
jgi:hypothetical protein